MNLPTLRRVDTKRLITALFLLMLISTPSRMTWGTPGSLSVNNLLLSTPGDGTVGITLSLSGDIGDIKPVYYENPSRLVFDMANTILVYNEGRSRKFPVEVGKLNSVAIAQFQNNPDIVHLVLFFKGGTRDELIKTVKMDSHDGKLIITYSSGEKPTPVPAETSRENSVLISKLLHQRVGPERDRFTFKGTETFADPQLKSMNGAYILTFKNARFEVPTKAGEEYEVPVGGAFVDEIQILNQSEGAVLYIRIKDSVKSFKFDTSFERISQSELRFDIARSYALQDDSSKAAPRPVKSSEGKVTGLVQVLGSGIASDETKLDGAIAKIIRIQYQPLSIGERFIIEAIGDFKPELAKLKYPSRLSLEAQNTSVVLPKGADDRFQVKIEGALSKLMKVFVKDVDGKPVSVLQFYYEIPDNEDIQYKFYRTENKNIYNLDLLPLASSAPVEKTEPKLQVVPKVEKPVQTEQPKPVIEVKPAAPPKEEVKAEEKTGKEESKKPDLVAFKIPTVEERKPTVDIPKAEPEPEEKKAEEKKVETPKPAPPAKPVKAPVNVQYEPAGSVDRFVITSDEPIDNYSRAEMNFPTRLAIEFPEREVKYGGLKPGLNHYINGKATDSVRIIEQDYPTPRSIFFINLNQGWDNTECSMSGSPGRIVIEVSRVGSEQAPLIAQAPKEEVAKPEIKPAVEEPKKPVEIKEEIKPQKPAEENIEEKIDSLNFVIENPQVTGDAESSFIVGQKKETVVREEETTEERILVSKEELEEEVEVVEPKPIKILPAVKDEFKEEPIQKTIEVKPSEQPATEPVEIEEPKTDGEKIEIKVINEDNEKPESEQLIAMFHPPDAIPLKKGEVVKPTNCIGSISWEPSVGLGQLTVSSTGAYLPQPEIRWFNYPSRLSFIFEDVGIDLTGAKQPDLWEQTISGTAVNKVQVIQESGERVPLTASAILYMQSGYDRTTVKPSVTKVSDNQVKIELIQVGTPPQPKSIEEVKPIEVPVVEKPIESISEEKVVKPSEEAAKVAPTAESEIVKAEIGAKKEGESAPAKIEVEKPADKAQEPLVTIILQNADIEDVLFLIAENTDIDISMESRAVKGTISLKVTKKPISMVFDQITNIGGFKWNKYEDVYIFGSEQFIWSFPGVVEPTVVHLKYADPTKVRQLITQMRLGGQNSVALYQAPNVSGAGGRLNVPTAQDALVLKGDERQVQNMMDLIKQIDVPPLMIKVNMKVIEVSLTDNKNIGFNWTNASGGGALNKGFISFSLTENFDETIGDLTFQGFKRSGEFDFNVVYNFLVDQGYAKILADSTLVTTNGGRGEFFVGETIPYRSAYQVSDFGRVTQRIQQEDIGMNMRFKAQATDDDTITLYLDPDLRNLKEITDIGPRTSKKNFTTTLRIKSGQPYAIGGLINESDRVTYDKIPFLGDLPLLGKFFRGKNKQLNRSEIVVIFTPEILRDAATMKYEEELKEREEENIKSSTFNLSE